MTLADNTMSQLQKSLIESNRSPESAISVSSIIHLKFSKKGELLSIPS